MSMEAQYYEAKRRQHIIERRQSLGARTDLVKQVRKPERQKSFKPFDLPARVFRPEEKRNRCTCTPLHMIILDDGEPVSFERNRDIYPRPKTAGGISAPRQYYQRDARLANRFTSTEYRQQW